MEQTTIPSIPPFPEDGTITGWALWFGNFLLWLVYDPRVRDVVIGIAIPLLAQVIAITFGEVMKMYPRWRALPTDSRKFWLRVLPIFVGATATFAMLAEYFHVPLWSPSWFALSLLNGAAAWPVFDRVVEPFILPWVYRKLAKWSGSSDKVVEEQIDKGDDESDLTMPQQRLKELQDKGYAKKEDPK